jgi:hypothetical protein
MFKELLADAWPIVEKVAPIIASAVGGPLVGSAATAITLLAKKFNIHDLTQIAAGILNDPQAEEKLAEANLDFSDEMTKAAVKSLSKLASAEIHVKLAWQN